MNFKKFISGVSALTIAASAFAGMAVTASASTTYTLPTNTKVGDVFVGSLNSDGSVSPETFTGYSNDDLAKWTIPGKYASSVSLKSVEEVAKPEIGSVCGENVYPTYVSGDVIDYYLREGTTNGRMWAMYDFDNVSSSNAKKLVFSADMWAQYTSSTYYLAFFDETNEPTADNKNGGTPLLELNWVNGGSLQYFRYSVNGTATTTNSNDTRSTWRTYRGYGISDLEIDLETGAVEFYVDCIADRYSAQRKRTKIAANIGAGKTISSFAIGRDAVSRTDIDTYIDNVELYSVVDAYAINTVDSESATVTSDMNLAKEGETVTVTAAPKSGYANPVISATYVDGNDAVQNIAVAADGTFTMPAYAVTVTATAEASDVAGYIINTTPYAAISVDGDTAVSTGSEGKYEFAVDTTGEHSVVISKTGYQTVNTTVTAANNDSTTLNLTLNNGTYFAEDFANVNDNYGFNAVSGLTVADGKVKFVPTSGDKADMATTFANSVDYNGRCITVNISATSSSTNNNMNFYLDGTPLRFYVYGPNLIIYGTGGTSITIPRPNDTTTIQITKGSRTQAQSLYVNGVQVSGNLYNNGSTTITGISAAVQKGSNFSFTLDDIAVTNMPSTAAITIDDDGTTSSTTYIAGTSFTLPAAAGKEGYTFDGWSDGTNTYAAGAALTADATKTYTAVYTQIAAPTSTFKAADWASTDEAYTAKGNTLKDAKDNVVYGYKTDITGNDGYSYTVKGYIKSEESGKSTTLTFGTITDASPMVFYLITDEALNLNASNVYCE